MQERRTIAIDGPAAVGKTVVGRVLARRLGFRFLDTGVMYRAVTLAALERAVPLEDDAGLTRLAQEIASRCWRRTRDTGSLWTASM